MPSSTEGCSVDCSTDSLSGITSRKVALGTIRNAEISRLPNELLRAIFLLAASQQLASTERRTSPETLVSVCRLWRAIAVQISEFWTMIKVSLCKGVDPLILSPAYLQRSGNRTLDIIITSSIHNGFEDEISTLLEVMELLVPHIARWRHIEVCAGYIPSLLQACRIWSGSANALESIRLTCYLVDRHRDLLAGESLLFDSTFIAPRLATLYFNGWPPFPDCQKLESVFPSLQEVCFADTEETFNEAEMYDASPMFQLIRSHPKVHTVTFDACHIPYLVQEQSFEHLVIINFMRIDGHDIHRILLHMQAPNMKHISLQDVFLDDSNSVAPFAHLAVDSRFPALESLHLDGFNTALSTEWQPLRLIFGSLDFCRRLYLHADLPDREDILMLLAISASPHIPIYECPHLVELHVYAPQVPAALLLFLALSRTARAFETLQELVVVTDIPISDEYKAVFEAIIPTFRWECVSSPTALIQ